MDTIGDRLRISRETAGDRIGKRYTQTDLGDVMGVTQPSIYKIENNLLKRGNVDVTRLMDAAKFLKVSFIWLATGNGQMEQDDAKLIDDPDSQKGFPVYWPHDLNRIYKTPQLYLGVPPVLQSRLTRSAYYTLVTDEGMNPLMRRGDLVLIDPSGPLHVGNLVLAQLPGQPGPIVRKIIENTNGEGYQLKPLGQDFATRPLEKIGYLLGVVMESRSLQLQGVSYEHEIRSNPPATAEHMSA